MLKFNTKKTLIIALVSLFLILALSGGVTVAFILDSTGSLENSFEPSNVSCAVVENGNDPVSADRVEIGLEKSEVSIKNTGDTKAFIRAKIIVNWKKADGTVYARQPEPETDYSITFPSGTDWAKGSHDFYYHKSAVEAGETTDTLIKSCAPVEGRAPEGYYLSVEIIASAIQAEPEEVAEDEWGVAVSGGVISSIPTN